MWKHCVVVRLIPNVSVTSIFLQLNAKHLLWIGLINLCFFLFLLLWWLLAKLVLFVSGKSAKSSQFINVYVYNKLSMISVSWCEPSSAWKNKPFGQYVKPDDYFHRLSVWVDFKIMMHMADVAASCFIAHAHSCSLIHTFSPYNVSFWLNK